MSKKETVFIVGEPSELLEFLVRSQSAKPKGKIKSELEHKLVSVDGRTTTKYNYPLKPGQRVEIGVYTPQYRKAESKLDIIYEDGELLAVSKPAGMLSVAADSAQDITAYRLVSEYIRENGGRGRAFVVHRLDRDTSGVLLFAKNEDIKHTLQDNWENAAIFRGYTAVTEGVPSPEEGRIENMLRETESHLVYAASRGDGKRAVTNYKVRRKSGSYALVDINIETGRKNQIRVHMNGLGCPIAGDKKYGAKTNPAHRLCLHADKLVIVHPRTGEKMVFASAVPKKLLGVLNEK